VDFVTCIASKVERDRLVCTPPLLDDSLVTNTAFGATKHRIRYIGCIGNIGVQIMLLLNMTQYTVVTSYLEERKVRVTGVS